MPQCSNCGVISTRFPTGCSTLCATCRETEGVANDADPINQYCIKAKVQPHSFIDEEGVERVCSTDNPACDYHLQVRTDSH